MTLKQISLLLIVGFIACSGSTKPGEGPGFSEDLTAEQLWSEVTRNFYFPEGAFGGSGIISGTFDCENGGSATVKDTRVDNVETFSVSYSNCEMSDLVDGEIRDLTLNGDVTIVAEFGTGNNGEARSEQHISYSGDLGFAADCDYTQKEENDSTTYSGECNYQDSEGNKLSIDGDGMNDLHNN